ncbi:hypothetical protein CJD36_012470 [Flavipsychrobacter stenotrophus]|uniref:Uncharacterized protein n=1 Tax=Flavipsychrobacter stenotrophus TaxID=2077091 RepID=A0A2S7SVP4_9BACT|nr:hypothetical protein [Flavipsychrobacter stenotrophus]PQJ10778.1 hypothetical protein CJD36_012470 [Flavipsychrobacter stenotrophus]
MNSNTTEEQVKQKIESLTTLQAGIVFGHEDAWDKLQARLDAKPTRKPFPVFRLAVAAALALAIITIAIMYLQPKQNNTSPDVIATLPNRDSNRSDVMVSPSNHDISIGQDHRSITDSFHSQTSIASAPVKPHHIKSSAPQPISPDPLVQIPQPTTDFVPTPAPTPGPVMKVVHINELGKEQAPVYEFADKDIPHPHVMFKMKVIHINNLMKPINQDDYLREMQNNTAVHFPLFRRPADRQPNDQPRTLFKINLSN